MATRPQAAGGPTNRLLGMLSREDYQRLRPHLRPSFRWRTGSRSIGRIGRLVPVYFIETGVGSLVNTMANGQAAEVGTIGNEGWSDCPCARRGIARHPASTFRDPARPLQVGRALPGAELAQESAMRPVMLRYAHALFNQVAQSAACNHLHPGAALLPLAPDHARPDAVRRFFPDAGISGMMLGVQRTGVSAVVGSACSGPG